MRCSQQDVLEVLADGWSYVTWVVGASRMRGVDAHWPQKGSHIAHSVGLWPLLIDDVTRSRWWDPDRGIELLAKAWPAGEALIRIEVLAAPEGCTVIMAEDVVRGPARLLPRPLRAAALVPRNRETLLRLEMLAVARPASAPLT